MRGYGFATPYATLLKYQEYVNEGRLLPGEGARILHLISDVVAYINTSKQTEISNVIFDVVRKILAQKDSLIDEEVTAHIYIHVYCSTKKNATSRFNGAIIWKCSENVCFN